MNGLRGTTHGRSFLKGHVRLANRTYIEEPTDVRVLEIGHSVCSGEGSAMQLRQTKRRRRRGNSQPLDEEEEDNRDSDEEDSDDNHEDERLT